jgi:hypothetical protein
MLWPDCHLPADTWRVTTPADVNRRRLLASPGSIRVRDEKDEDDIIAVIY